MQVCQDHSPGQFNLAFRDRIYLLVNLQLPTRQRAAFTREQEEHGFIVTARRVHVSSQRCG